MNVRENLVSAASRDAMVRAKPEPRGEVVFGWPGTDIVAYLGEDGLCGDRPDGRELGQVHTEDAAKFIAQIERPRLLLR